jgi:hypothetical protein
MRADDEKIGTLSEERHERADTMTAAENLHSLSAIAEAHVAGTRTYIPAFEALYQAMSAEQQMRAIRVFRAAGPQLNTKPD